MNTPAPAQAAPAGAKPRSYECSAFPDPYRILGLKLLPFSLGHYLLLRRFDCAFVREEESTASHADLILGVIICSMRPGEFLEFLESPTFGREIKAWGKKLGSEVLDKKSEPIYPFDFKAKAELFMRYLRDGWQEPPHINKGGGSATGDWVQNIKTTLMARLNYSDAEVMEMPMSKALSDYYKLAESEGVIQLLTEADLEAMAKNDAALDALSETLKTEPRWQA